MRVEGSAAEEPEARCGHGARSQREMNTNNGTATRLSERILYWLVERLYHTEVAHTEEMKNAVRQQEFYEAHRANEFAEAVAAARRYGVDWNGKDVLDIGCQNGSLTVQYLQYGARRVVGIDIDADAVRRAQEKYAHPSVEYLVSAPGTIPLPDNSIDAIVGVDVFEHVAQPLVLLRECRRVLRPGGGMLIRTWGWYHPFAPHLWATIPVPWAHVVFSEKTLMRTAHRVFHSSWYKPIMWDFDEQGRKDTQKYQETEISTDYLNKFLMRDFERAFKESGLHYRMHLLPFSSRYARWTKPFIHLPYVREFFTSYFWAALSKTLLLCSLASTLASSTG